jgi:tripartite ATP-independent transporter DctM subunit
MENILLVFLILLAGLLFLLLSGMWIAVALALIGFLGLTFAVGGGMQEMLEVLQLRAVNSFELCSIPLFVLLGNLMLHSGLMTSVYHGINPFLSRLPGGLLHTNIGACGIFGACSGSSIAAAATIGQFAIPVMKKLGYHKQLIYGSLAGGGTLSSMIPPSICFILYGAWVGESVGALFIAGIIPGLILALFFMTYIMGVSLLHPNLQPKHEKIPFRDSLKFLIQIIPVLFIVFAVLGTIYLGIATPTEAAGLGVTAALIICLISRKLTWDILKDSLRSTVKTTTMVFFILVGAMAFSMVISMLKIPEALSLWVFSLGLGKWTVFLMVVFIYIVLGAIIDPTSMMLMTLSVTYPLMMKMGFNSIWFGVCMAVFVEMAVITPPLGLNLFVIHSISGERNISVVTRGSIPYFICMLVLLAILYFFPQIALWLPQGFLGQG